MKIAILIALLLAHLTGPGMAYAPVQDEYRVEVLRARLEKINAVIHWASTHGLEVYKKNNNFIVWKKEWR